MSAPEHEHSNPARHAAGSPAGGRFAPTRRTESGVDLTLVDPTAPTDADWSPSDADFADIGAPLPHWAPGSSGYGDNDESYTRPEDEYVGSRQAEEEADRMENRWLCSTLLGS